MISDQIIQVLDAIAERMGVAVTWTADNVLPYAQQLCAKYILYNIVSSLVSTAICAVVVGIAWKAATHFHKQLKALGGDWDIDTPSLCGTTIGYVCFGIGGIILLCMTCSTASTVVTGITFPEKMILDYVQNFLAAG